MKRSKLTLIIDGNWLLMSRLLVIAPKYSDSKSMVKDLQILMIRSINLVLKTFPAIDNIIFVADGGSWRNYDLEIPQFLVDRGIEYKGNREHPSDIDLDSVFEAYENMIDILNANGICSCKERGIEGDDWCLWWSNKLNSEGTNCIIWSKDKDLTQLVSKNEDGCFTVWWNKENGVYCMEDNEDECDYLLKTFTPKALDNDNIFNSILNKSSNITKINPNDIVIDKIIRGDQGDNVLPIIVKKPQNPNSNRQYKISVKDIDYSIDIYNDTEIKKYIDNICSMKQYKNRMYDSTPEEIFEHFVYNRNLVSLNFNTIPSYIVDIMKKYNVNEPNKDLSKVEQSLIAQGNEIKDILDEI